MKKLNALLALGLLATTGLVATPIFLLSTQTASGAPNGTNCVNVGQVCGSYLATVDFTAGVNTTNFGAILSGYQATGEEIFDIAVNTAGEIYGITASRLYRINPNGSGAYNLQFILNHGINGGNALAFAASGLLYAAGNETRITQINLGTNVVTPLADWAGFGFGSGGDVAFLGARLFVGTSSQQIAEVDPSTGQVIGTPGPGGMNAAAQAIKGLASDGTDLYAVYQVSGGQEILGRVIVNGALFGQISGAHSMETLSGLLNTAGTFGLPSGMSSFAPVPEPSTVFLSVIGAALVGFGRRNRKQ